MKVPARSLLILGALSSLLLLDCRSDGSIQDPIVKGDGGGGEGGSGGQGPERCASMECELEGECLEAGRPKLGDPCSVCLPTSSRTVWTRDPTSPSCHGGPYWRGVSRSLATTPYGGTPAISCHNCYVTAGSSAESLAATLGRIHEAQALGADLIELDVKYEDRDIYVEHDDTGRTTSALLAEVLEDGELTSGDQLLYVESKEQSTSERYVARLLDLLRYNGHGIRGRPVVLRSFPAGMANLRIARKLVATPDYASMRPYLRLHVLYSWSKPEDARAIIREVRAQGFHAIEFDHRSPDLFGALRHAESLGLGTGVWTIPRDFGEVFVAAFRDEVASITTALPADQARRAVASDNGLVYLNAWSQSPGASSLFWFGQDDFESTTLSVREPGAPSLTESSSDRGPFGTSLEFTGSEAAALDFDDDEADAGYLVTTVVALDRSLPSEGSRSFLLRKGAEGGFSLDLIDPPGRDAAALRFGVYVNDRWAHASLPAERIPEGITHYLIGVYDGASRVRLWLNGSDVRTTPSRPTSGGVTPDELPVVMGADSEMLGDFFRGRIQLLLIQRWDEASRGVP